MMLNADKLYDITAIESENGIDKIYDITAIESENGIDIEEIYSSENATYRFTDNTDNSRTDTTNELRDKVTIENVVQSLVKSEGPELVDGPDVELVRPGQTEEISTNSTNNPEKSGESENKRFLDEKKSEYWA